jgi:hypothetical protein
MRLSIGRGCHKYPQKLEVKRPMNQDRNSRLPRVTLVNVFKQFRTGKVMTTFLCRWSNGDFSVVVASNKEDAINKLNEIDSADDCEITALKEFLVSFKLADDGEFVCEGLGEVSRNEILTAAYPALMSGDPNAVKQERDRLWDGDK